MKRQALIMITLIIIIILATCTISSGFTIYSTSWLQSWRLVLMDQVQRNLRWRNQDERKRSCSRGRDRRSCLSGFEGNRALQHWPMPRLHLIPMIWFLLVQVTVKLKIGPRGLTAVWPVEKEPRREEGELFKRQRTMEPPVQLWRKPSLATLTNVQVIFFLL